MNPILLSFLCGAAFIGGGVAVTIMVSVAVSFRDTRARNEMARFWRDSLAKHDRQLLVLERIAAAIEKR